MAKGGFQVGEGLSGWIAFERQVWRWTNLGEEGSNSALAMEEALPQPIGGRWSRREPEFTFASGTVM